MKKKQRYRAILSDYDGTLAGPDGTVSPRTHKAVQTWIRHWY
jgi:hydroxymethylpyrimidine pyrophosphatase-like HAD family hydrolase